MREDTADGTLDGVNTTRRPGPVQASGSAKCPTPQQSLPLALHLHADQGQEIHVQDAKLLKAAGSPPGHSSPASP